MSIKIALELIDRAISLEPGKWPYHRELCDLSLRALNSIPDQVGYYTIKGRFTAVITRSDYFKREAAMDLVESLRIIRRELEEAQK